MKNEQASVKPPPKSENSYTRVLAHASGEIIPISEKRRVVIASEKGLIKLALDTGGSDEKMFSIRSSRPRIEPRPTRASLLRVRREDNAVTDQGRSSRMPPLRSTRAPSMPSPAWGDVEGGGLSIDGPTSSSQILREPWQNMSQQRRQNQKPRKQQHMMGGSGSGQKQAKGWQKRAANKAPHGILPDAVGAGGREYDNIYASGLGDERFGEEGFSSSSRSSFGSMRSDSGSGTSTANNGEMELLPGWEAATDPKTGKPYYFNRETGARTWDWRKVISQAPKQRPLYSPRVEKNGKKQAPRRPTQLFC